MASVAELLRNPGLLAAIGSQVGGYFAMIFTMTACPLAMTARGIEYPAIAGTISAHAVAMFLPGLVTGDIIRRTSCATVMAAGVLLYGCTIAVALRGETTSHFVAALVCVGLGWNFLYTAGSAMLVKSVGPAARPKAQAMAETTQQLGNLTASVASGVAVANRGAVHILLIPSPFCKHALANLNMPSWWPHRMDRWWSTRLGGAGWRC